MLVPLGLSTPPLKGPTKKRVEEKEWWRTREEQRRQHRNRGTMKGAVP